MLAKLLLIKLCTLPVKSSSRCKIRAGRKLAISTIYNIGATLNDGVKWELRNVNKELVFERSFYSETLHPDTREDLKVRKSISHIITCTLEVSNSLSSTADIIENSMYSESDIMQVIRVAKNIGILKGLSREDDKALRSKYGAGVTRGLPVSHKEVDYE